MCIGLFSMLMLIVLILIILRNGFSVNNESNNAVYALIGVECLLFVFLMYFVVLKLYENLVIKKAILRSINADDAVLRKVILFEVNHGRVGIFHRESIVGVRFKYNDNKVLMVSKKYLDINAYLDKECQIVYSPSCDDVVLLKADKTRKHKRNDN